MILRKRKEKKSSIAQSKAHRERRVKTIGTQVSYPILSLSKEQRCKEILRVAQT